MSAQCPDCLRRRTSSTRPSRDHEAERLGGLEVDDQFVFRRCLHRQVGRFLALEDTIDVASRAAELVVQVRPVGDEATGCGVVAAGVDRG
jgi:hypothetical protein